MPKLTTRRQETEIGSGKQFWASHWIHRCLQAMALYLAELRPSEVRAK